MERKDNGECAKACARSEVLVSQMYIYEIILFLKQLLPQFSKIHTHKV